MADLDFLDTLSTTAPVSTDTPTGPDTSAPAVATTNEAASEGASTTKYTNIVGTYASLDEANAAHDDLLTISDYAQKQTLHNITQMGRLTDGYVDKSYVYAATKAAKNAFPVVLVGETAYIPMAAGFAVYEERLANKSEGGTTANGGKLTEDDFLRLSEAARTKVDFLDGQLKKLTARIDKAAKLLAKREQQGTERFGTKDAFYAKVDEWASANEETLPDDSDAKTGENE